MVLVGPELGSTVVHLQPLRSRRLSRIRRFHLDPIYHLNFDLMPRRGYYQSIPRGAFCFDVLSLRLSWSASDALRPLTPHISTFSTFPPHTYTLHSMFRLIFVLGILYFGRLLSNTRTVYHWRNKREPVGRGTSGYCPCIGALLKMVKYMRRLTKKSGAALCLGDRISGWYSASRKVGLGESRRRPKSRMMLAAWGIRAATRDPTTVAGCTTATSSSTFRARPLNSLRRFAVFPFHFSLYI